MPVLVTVIGAWAAQSIAGYYGRQQREIAQAEAAEKYIPYFDKDRSPQQRYLAVQSLIAIGNYDAAADLVVTLPHNYAAIQKARRARENATEDGKVPTKQSHDQKNSENGTVGDAATKEDDDNFSSILSLYYPELLPRLTYLAGVAKVLTNTAPGEKSAGEKSVDVIKLIVGDSGGMQQVEGIAFTPRILNKGWRTRVRFRYQQFKESVLGDEEAISLARTQRLGAIRAIDSRLQELGRGAHIYQIPESYLTRRLKRYQKLSDPLLRVVGGWDGWSYSPEARAEALSAAMYLESPLQPSPRLGELQSMALDPLLPETMRSEIINELDDSRNVTSATITTFQTLIESNICDRGGSSCVDILLFSNDKSMLGALKGAVSQRLSRVDEGGDWLVSFWFDVGGTLPELMQLFESAPDRRKAAILRGNFGRMADGKPAVDEATVIGIAKKNLQNSSAQVREAAYDIVLVGKNTKEAQLALAQALQDNSSVVLQTALRHVNKTPECELLPNARAHVAALPEPNDRAVTLDFVAAAEERCKGIEPD